MTKRAFSVIFIFAVLIATAGWIWLCYFAVSWAVGWQCDVWRTSFHHFLATKPTSAKDT
jgi:hypothetical protein